MGGHVADFDCDLFVIGGGSGGVRAARIAANHGARVVLAEKNLVGGTCVHAGCVPKKLLVFAAETARALQHAPRYGFDPELARTRVPHSWSALLHAVHEETARLGDLYELRLREAGVEIERGVARMTGAHAVELNGRARSARHILIATGGKPQVPEIPGRALILTSDDVFHLPALPQRVVVVGGGYIGLELACVLAGLGANVVLVHRGVALLTGFDHDVRAHIARELPLHGIDLRLSAQVTAVAETANGGRSVTLADATQIDCDAVIFATGRRPQTVDLGLEAIGVALDERGAVRVDAFSQSSVGSVHAIGDVTGRVALTPVAIAEGHALADTLFGRARRSAHDMLIPTAVFTDPEIATVGQTEECAREQGAELDIYRATFRPLEHALDGSRSRALVKLVVDRATQKVIGCHVVSPNAAEIVQGLAAAMSAGVTKQQLDTTIGIHPTVAEELLTLRKPV